jgi:hypothetical protein
VAGWIFMKYGMDVVPLEIVPNSYFSIKKLAIPT